MPYRLIVLWLDRFYRMGISQLPDVDFPVVTVSVTWRPPLRNHGNEAPIRLRRR